MYRVLFVEDELLVRAGLKNSVNWELYDMEIVGEAGDGLTAFQMFCELKPDILITDIKMNGMDGYELIRAVREIDSKCAIVIISCVDDFEALRKMMGYCIIGYILKASMTFDEINDVLEQTRNYLQSIGRKPMQQIYRSENLENRIESFLREERSDTLLDKKKLADGKEKVKGILLWEFKEADREKISSLAIKTVLPLFTHFFSNAVVVTPEDYEIVMLWSKEPENLEENLTKLDASVWNFFGLRCIHFQKNLGEMETIREAYEELKCRETKEDSPLMEKALRYISRNYYRELSLQDVADHLCISYSYFSALFKKTTGKGFVEYLNDYRLEKILEELRTSQDKLAVIAARNGFQNQEYFSRFFKKKMGISPIKWRQLNTKNNRNEDEL